MTGHTNLVTPVAVGEVDGRPIAVTGSEDQTVRIWDLRESRSSTIAVGAPIEALALIKPSGIVVGTSSGLLRLTPHHAPENGD